MNIRSAQLARAIHLLDQQRARVEGGYSLEDIFAQIPTIPQHHEGHKCIFNDTITCGQELDEPCEGCPVWNEIDGE